MATTKTTKIGFRIPNEDYEKFSKKAEEANMTLTAFFKQAVMNNQTVVVAQTNNSKVDNKEVLYVLNKASNNINQIAKRINVDHKKGVLDKRQYDLLHARLTACWIELKRGMDNANKG